MNIIMVRTTGESGMGIGCKVAGIKYDLFRRYPLLDKLERRMCVVERELNKGDPCFYKKRRRPCVERDRKCGCKECR